MPGRDRPPASDAVTGTTMAAVTEVPQGVRLRFPALRHRDFRVLWIGMWFSSATMLFQFYAQGWFVLSLTDSAALLGVLGVSRGAGMLVFSLFGGALADRVERRRLLLVTQASALFIYALLTILVLLDSISLWQAFVLIFISAAVSSVDAPARQALLPDLVPREDLPNAVSLLSAAQISSFAFLPPLAGVAIEETGSGGAFALSLVGYVAVIVALLLMRHRGGVTPHSEGLARSVGEGLQYSSRRPDVLWVILLSLFVGCLGMPVITTLAPLWMRNELNLGPVGWTVMGQFWGMGTVISSFTFSFSAHRSRHLGLITVLSGAGFAISLVVFSLTRSIPLAGAAWFVNGIFFTANMISSSALLQVIVAKEYMGRVMSLRTLSGAVNQLSAAPLGALADGIGIARMVPAVSTLLAVLILAPAALFRTVRHLDDARWTTPLPGPERSAPEARLALGQD